MYLDESIEDDGVVSLENTLRWIEKTAQLVLGYLRITKNKNYKRMERFIDKKLFKYMHYGL
jgi:hypothetical protein